MTPALEAEPGAVARDRQFFVRLLRALPLVAFAIAWQLCVESEIVDSQFLPSLASTAAAFADIAEGREFWLSLLVSLYRAIMGLVLGSAVGIALGAFMATSRRANGFWGPLVGITYSLPKSALVPLFILWFGIGNVTNILVVVLSCLLPVVVSTYHGVKAVPELLVWSARAMGTPRREVLIRILLPASLPSILSGIRIALGFSFVLTLSAEMIAAKSGIGKLIYLYGENGAYAHMFAGIAAVVVLAYSADRALLRAERHLLRWHDSIEAQHRGC